jgi:hypothetical protein
MALHDFFCPTCGHDYPDVNIPIEIGAAAGAPLCVKCGSQTEWIPQVGRMDAANGPGFVAFDCYNSRNEPIHVSSLKQLRTIERQSEVDQRNGEGQPMVWRRYSQDRSNVHSHTLGTDPQQAPTKDAARKFGPEIRRSAEEPNVTFGPGVTESNASALKEAP